MNFHEEGTLGISQVVVMLNRRREISVPCAKWAAIEINSTVLSKALLDQVLIGDQIRLL